MSKLTSVASYSQYGEDLILWGALANVRKGFYIDVGAIDPVKGRLQSFFMIEGGAELTSSRVLDGSKRSPRNDRAISICG